MSWEANGADKRRWQLRSSTLKKQNVWIWISHGVNIFFPESLSLNNNLANYI